MAISKANALVRSSIPSLSHGKAIYQAIISSTTGTTTDISAVGDVVLTFDAAFRSVPKILGLAFTSETTGTTIVYPTAWVKTVTKTALTVSVGGLVGTLLNPTISVLLEAEA